MAGEADRQRRHFILEGVTEIEPYRYPGSGGGGASEIPARNRPEHGGELRRQIGELRTVADLARDAQQAAGMEDGLGSLRASPKSNWPSKAWRGSIGPQCWLGQTRGRETKTVKVTAFEPVTVGRHGSDFHGD